MEPAGGEEQLGLNSLGWLLSKLATRKCHVNGTFVPCCEKQRLLWKERVSQA
jgi:hypothetical protein